MKLSHQAAFAIMQGFKADGRLGRLSEDIFTEIKACHGNNYLPYKMHIRVFVGEFAPMAAELAWNKQWKQAQLFLIKHGFQKKITDKELQNAKSKIYAHQKRKTQHVQEVKELFESYNHNNQWSVCK